MDKNRDDFRAWLASELAKAKELNRSSDMWTRKKADNRLEELTAAQRIWDEFKAEKG